MTGVTPPPRLPGLIRTVLRLAIVALLVILINIGLNHPLTTLGQAATPGQQLALNSILLLCLVLYAILMAMPFVPGVEVGMSLLMMQGAKIAPFVFLATFCGLTLAYLFGRHLSHIVLRNVLRDLGLTSAVALLDRLQPLDRPQRLDLVIERLPNWIGATVIRHRYLAVALALNIPGNAVIGGGGGIAMIAGISGLFRTPIMLLTFALAVSPVPILVWSFGMQALDWLPF